MPVVNDVQIGGLFHGVARGSSPSAGFGNLHFGESRALSAVAPAAAKEATATPDEIIAALKQVRKEGNKVVEYVKGVLNKKGNFKRLKEIEKQWAVFDNSVAKASEDWRTKKIAPTKYWVEKTRAGILDVVRVWKGEAADANTSVLQRYMSGLVYDIGDAMANPDLFADAILNATLPNSIRDKIVNDIIANEKALADSYNKLKKAEAKLAKFPANDQRRADFKKQLDLQKKARDQQYASHNEWKFWAMLLPIFAAPLKGKVKPPSVALVKQTSTKGALMNSVAKDLVAGKVKDGTFLAGLGAIQLVGAAGVAAVIVGGIAAIAAIAGATFLIIRALDSLDFAIAAACEAAGWCAPGTAGKVAESNAKARGSMFDALAAAAKYGAIGAGLLGALYVYSKTKR